MKLSPRLQYLIEHIDANAHCIDVAADHGYLALELKRQNTQRQLIVSDIAKLPLASAQKHFIAAGLAEGTDFRLGSGLQVLLPGEQLDVAIIAGVGGRLIVDILSENATQTAQVGRFLLQANIGMSVLREWLYEHHFWLLDDALVQDGKHIYECLVTEQREMPDPTYSPIAEERLITYHFGSKIHEQDPIVRGQWLTEQTQRLQKKVDQLTAANSEEAQVKKDLYTTLLSAAKELL